MKKLLLAGLLAIGLSGIAGTAFAGDQDFTLINKTGLTFDQVYISAANTDDWEEDVLGKDTLDNGEEWDLHWNKGERACKFDMKVVDTNGRDHIFYGIDLCKLTKLTLKKQGDKFVYTWVND